jgi:hypothetical protein
MDYSKEGAMVNIRLMILCIVTLFSFLFLAAYLLDTDLEHNSHRELNRAFATR